MYRIKSFAICVWGIQGLKKEKESSQKDFRTYDKKHMSADSAGVVVNSLKAVAYGWSCWFDYVLRIFEFPS